ncbi:MAG: RidA family protein [Caldilineaceae bacterium]
MNRQTVSSGTVWEELAGYSRAIKVGNHIFVSGTTATDGEGQVVGAGDPAAQARFILNKIESALLKLGSKLEDVVRTRIYIRNINDWEAVAHVHGERFARIRPANTLVKAELVGDDYLVEIEAEAFVQVERTDASLDLSAVIGIPKPETTDPFSVKMPE